jgi:hypothetical protein
MRSESSVLHNELSRIRSVAAESTDHTKFRVSGDGVLHIDTLNTFSWVGRAVVSVLYPGYSRRAVCRSLLATVRRCTDTLETISVVQGGTGRRTPFLVCLRRQAVDMLETIPSFSVLVATLHGTYGDDEGVGECVTAIGNMCALAYQEAEPFCRRTGHLR